MPDNNNAPATISTLNGFTGGNGSSAAIRLLNSGMSVNSLRTNAILRRREWEEIDERVQSVAQARLNGIADLRQYGLVHNLGGLGSIISIYEQLVDMTGAHVDMDALTEGRNDSAGFQPVSIPVPFIHKPFQVDIRRLQASRRTGDGLDVTNAGRATRKVSEGLENMLFNGAELRINVDGKPSLIYGYTTHPDRTQVEATGAWDDPQAIHDTVNLMIQAANDNHYYGPFGLYIAQTQFGQTRQRYKDGSGQIVRKTLREIDELSFVKGSSFLKSGEAILVCLDHDCVDIAIAQDIIPTEWEELGGFVVRFKIWGVMVPRIKSDSNGNCGHVHCRGTA